MGDGSVDRDHSTISERAIWSNGAERNFAPWQRIIHHPGSAKTLTFDRWLASLIIRSPKWLSKINWPAGRLGDSAISATNDHAPSWIRADSCHSWPRLFLRAAFNYLKIDLQVVEWHENPGGLNVAPSRKVALQLMHYQKLKNKRR